MLGDLPVALDAAEALAGTPEELQLVLELFALAMCRQDVLPREAAVEVHEDGVVALPLRVEHSALLGVLVALGKVGRLSHGSLPAARSASRVQPVQAEEVVLHGEDLDAGEPGLGGIPPKGVGAHHRAGRR